MTGDLPEINKKYEGEINMKVSYLFSATLMTTAFFLGAVNADAPDPSINIQACKSAAQGEINALNRCDAIAQCQKYQSDTEGNLKECIYQAEQAYKDALAGRSPQATSAVTTNPADSEYERKATDSGKGWGEAN